MALEDLLREAAKRGITHLSLSPTPSEDNKTVYWLAKATPSTEHKYVQCACADPVDAVTQVLQAMAKAPKRAAPTKRFDSVSAPVSEMPQRANEITATVTEPPGQETQAQTETEPVPAAPAAPLNLEEEFASWLPKP